MEAGDPIQNMSYMIGDYIKKHTTGNIKAISIGFPGEVSVDGQTPLSLPNLRNGDIGFDGKNVVVPLQEQFHVPVFINKDGNNHLQCDIKLRKLYDKGIIVGIYFGTGIGGSIFINNSFLSGQHGAAMVPGHIPFYKGDMISHVGDYSCAECYASGYYLRQLWEQTYQNKGIALNEIFKHCKQDPAILDFIEACAVTAATPLNLLDPHMLIIGGGVVEMDGFPVDMLICRIRELCKKPYPSSDIDITTPVVKNNSGIIGAAFYAFDMLE